MILETLDIKVGDKLIYSENTFDLDNNFKMILKDENPKSVRSIHYNDVGRYILDSTPKSLMVYRLLTNVDGIKGDMIKYGFLVYINGVREAIYFDPIFAIKEIEDIGYLYEDNLRFRIQQLGLMSSISIKNECTYSEVYSFDLEPDEVHGQNDRVFAEAIFAFDSVDFDSVQGISTPKRDWNHIGNFSESKKVNVAQDPNYDPLRTTRLKVVTAVTPNQFQPQQTKSTEEKSNTITAERRGRLTIIQPARAATNDTQVREVPANPPTPIPETPTAPKKEKMSFSQFIDKAKTQKEKSGDEAANTTALKSFKDFTDARAEKKVVLKVNQNKNN